MLSSIDRMELPRWYDENKMVLMVVTPHTVFLYWELAFSQWKAVAGHQLIVRLFALAPEQPTEQPRLVTSAALPVGTENWYFNDLPADSQYQADMGWEQDGVFYSLLKSNSVRVPPAEPLGVAREAQWQSMKLGHLPGNIAATTSKPDITVNEILNQMSFYMGIHNTTS
ncbi:hypothetical protein SPSYN_00998 [Sporotomaculum syntrophicum]|uniref:DUF4912 domain-containing protein n=1 Tax=Sporotomaculum syntrophicum TaxID=182264 RepID=A0A9D2WRX2_9FIRM|nr:DUF4912 domain-containing protein [Sporotomaculum syntrophicum]KAF1086254.1 hypothetical protein SPSYN_00998 [Sporotomaculum syntrophicum]